MGNWRRVWIVGVCPADEVHPLRDALKAPDWANLPLNDEDWPEIHCLMIGAGLCGLNLWPAEMMSVIGNLYERDYSPEDVRRAAERFVLPVAPGIDVLIHCGGEYESGECVATVKVSGGVAELLPPAVPSLPEIDESAIAGRLFAAIFKTD